MVHGPHGISPAPVVGLPPPPFYGGPMGPMPQPRHFMYGGYNPFYHGLTQPNFSECKSSSAKPSSAAATESQNKSKVEDEPNVRKKMALHYQTTFGGVPPTHTAHPENSNYNSHSKFLNKKDEKPAD